MTLNVQDAQTAAYMASLAYKPPVDAEALLHHDGYDYQAFDRNGTQAFIANKDDTIWVSFRGTEVNKVEDVLTDIKFRKVRAYRGRVHRGFLIALQQVAPAVLGAVAKIGVKTHRLFVTGHSLGAALATLFAQEVMWGDVKGVFLFGSPRVGSPEYARSYDLSLKDRTWRFVNSIDAVPHWPWAIINYRHVGQLVYWDRTGQRFDRLRWPKRIAEQVAVRIRDGILSGGLRRHPRNNYVKLAGTLQ